MIWEELNPSLIFQQVEAKKYADVMMELGNALIKCGYAKESYVDALIERESEFPTGLDVDGFGVAIPHTDVSHVLKEGIAIGVLKEPVTFVQMGTDDETVEVRLVFMLAVLEPNAHIERLQRILEIIQDADVLDKIVKAADKEEILEIIKNKEEAL